MLDVFGFPSPQQSNYQEFYGGGTTRDWVKPRGASMVRFMLIGGGGGGGNGSGSVGGGGGGSAAVTQWIGPAIFVPSVLRIYIGAGGPGGGGSTNGEATTVTYQEKTGVGYTLLTANGGASGSTSTTGGLGATATANNFFGASGIFSSIAGVDGAAGGSTGDGQNSNNTGLTFLLGGAGGSGGVGLPGGSVLSNFYDYPSILGTTSNTGTAASGFFVTGPLMFGCGGAGGGTNAGLGQVGGTGGIGCGGGGAGEDATNGAGRGGDGAVFVWAW